MDDDNYFVMSSFSLGPYGVLSGISDIQYPFKRIHLFLASNHHIFSIKNSNKSPIIQIVETNKGRKVLKVSEDNNADCFSGFDLSINIGEYSENWILSSSSPFDKEVRFKQWNRCEPFS